MAKSKEAPKPIFPIKHEFYAALDNFIHQSMMLHNAVKTIMQHDSVSPAVRDILRERIEAFEKAFSSDD